MAKKPQETNLPLILALVFFILTTIAFGVMWYLSYSDTENLVAEAKKAKDEQAPLKNAARDAELKAIVYRLYMGLPTDPNDKSTFETEVKAGDVLSAEVKRINETVAKELGETDPDKLPDIYKLWSLDSTGKAGTPPAKGLLSLVGEIKKGRDDGIKAAADERAAYKAQIDSMKKAAGDLVAVQAKFQEQIDKLPRQFKDDLQKVKDDFDKRIDVFKSQEANSGKTIIGLQSEVDGLKAQIRRLNDQITDLQDNNRILQEKAGENRGDKFTYDEPQGKVLRKLKDGVVEINIGSAVNVRPGLTFTVLPSDFPEKGRQSRMRTLRIPDDRGGFKPVERFVPRGAIEVYEVLGPNLSLARITPGSELDPIRDGIGVGDLIYNATWRKGVADRVALIGIFDTNGDGIDDIETVVRDLTKMGVPVDAYFDMRKRVWVGTISERTRFIIQGYYPNNSAADPNRDEKTKLLGAMGTAVTEGKQKGADTVNFRDFFSRMGYKFRLDVSEDRINQATAPYLSNVGSSPIPMPSNP